MRTTLILQDDLLREAKKRAAERNLTVSDFVNEALRAALMPAVKQAPPYTPITFGEPGANLRHEPSDFFHAFEQEDQGRLR
jgi:hypothetical protein